jgi:hypothetical protein
MSVQTLEQSRHVCLDRAPDVDHSVNRLQFQLSSRMQNKSDAGSENETENMERKSREEKKVSKHEFSLQRIKLNL